MKLSDYAKYLGVSYQTAWRQFKKGVLPHRAYQLKSGTVIVDFDPNQGNPVLGMTKRAAIYARVSSAENKTNLDSQAERLTQYAAAKGYQVVKIVKEVGSGLNDSRRQLASLLSQSGYEVLIVEHKDRLARFGTNYIDLLLKRLGITLEVVNLSENGTDELMTDLVSIIRSFAARLYGQRRAKRKTEKIIAELQSNSNTDE
ncbi:IS607 family transposase [Scytonema sp. NUACC26]|uniref:IS607 family transposase n=1 Tax=Scytonema sp. NUACC26 TaxID=3140176 RepID=UPI0034DC84DE